MRVLRFIGILSFSVSGSSFALTSTHFKENADLSVSLSNSNYNRLVVKGDKITQVHFPEGMMAVSNETDGGLYVMVSHPEPFTIFVTTELGRHFSLTVNTEAGLGKTVEFVADGNPAPVLTSATKVLAKIPEPTFLPSNVTELMTGMLKNNVSKDYESKKYFNRAIRLGQGMTLFPKLTYKGKILSGEVTEIYNGSNNPIDLNESLFNGEGVKAISLSKNTLAPHDRALVYRVLEQAHG
jgi:conjugal transfer pilus assembly protein TraK